MSTKPPRLIS